ncbi:hypothetical protein L9F63_012007, partial [Diploptera punctata]
AVRHLPSSQQEEYRRLKQQIAKRELQMKQKLQNLNKSLSLSSSSPMNSSAIAPLKVTVKNASPLKEDVARNNSISVTLENCSRKIFTSSQGSSSKVVKKTDSDILSSKVSNDNRLQLDPVNNTAKRDFDENMTNKTDSKYDKPNVRKANVAHQNTLSHSANHLECNTEQTVKVSSPVNDCSETSASGIKENETMLTDIEHQLLSKRQVIFIVQFLFVLLLTDRVG